MTIERPSATWLRAGMALALVALCSGTSIAAAEEPTGVDYELLVEGQAVSIQAVDRPLIHVLRDLGDKLKFEVDTDIGEDLRVTVTFRDRPVDEAISILCKQVGYLIARDPADNRIQSLVLTPKKGNVNRAAARPAEPPQQAGDEADDAQPVKPNRAMSIIKPEKRDD